MKICIASHATFLAALFRAACGFSQAQPLTLVSTFDLRCASQVYFQPEGNLEIRYWDQHYAQIQVEITDEALERRQLKSLVALGIYTIETSVVEDLAKLDMPGMRKLPLVDGVPVRHQMAFTLTLPRYAKVFRSNDDIPLWAGREQRIKNE